MGTNGAAGGHRIADEPHFRPNPPPVAPVSTEPGLLSQLSDQFGPELSQLKKLAIGTTLGLVRDMITQSAPPELGQQLGEMMDSVTTKIGGQTIRGPILEPALELADNPRKLAHPSWSPVPPQRSRISAH